MGILLLFCAAADDGFTLERNVQVWSVDTLGRLREIHRKERVKYRAGNLLIEDLTFGRKILVRTDLKKVWHIDTLGETYSELTFEQIRARQEEALQELRACRARVKGSMDEGELTGLLQSYGWYDADVPVEAQSNGRSGKIAGRDCRGMNLVVNKDVYLFSEVLVDPALPAAGYFEALNRLSSFPEKTAARFQDVGGVPLHGVVRHVYFLERTRADLETTSVTTGEIPAADFEPPIAGLTKVPLRNFEKMPARKIEKPKEYGKNREDEIDREQNPFRQGDKK